MAKVAYRYTADNGDNFRIRLEDVGEMGDELGLAAAQAGDVPFSFVSKTLRPRKAAVIRSDGRTVWVICGTNNAPAYTTQGTNVSTYKFRTAAPLNGTAYGYHGERRIFPRPAPPV